MSSAAESGCISILAHIRRHRDLTREQFYEHWENVHAPKVIPWAEKHGIRRYQQLHISGSMIPDGSSTGDLPTTPVEFDGIVLWLVPSIEQFTNAFNDPYYLEVIEPDECVFLDKAGPGKGVIASFNGKMVDMIQKGQSAARDRGSIQEHRKLLEEYEKRA